jgi:hypothetical protein
MPPFSVVMSHWELRKNREIVWESICLQPLLEVRQINLYTFPIIWDGKVFGQECAQTIDVPFDSWIGGHFYPAFIK